MLNKMTPHELAEKTIKERRFQKKIGQLNAAQHSFENMNRVQKRIRRH